MLFSSIIGQEHAKSILSNLVQKRHFPPLLFIGPKGVGKRTTAINFAQIINCPEKKDVSENQCLRCKQIGNLNNFDVKLIFPIPQRKAKNLTKLAPNTDDDTLRSDMPWSNAIVNSYDQEKEKTQNALTHIGENISNYVLGKIRPELPATNYHSIDIIHWLKSEMSFKPVINNNKVIIIVDADRMRHDAANALLKTLEEPQQDTLFILTAERISNILLTIRSRCQVIRFASITKEQITQYLVSKKQISEKDAQFAATIAGGNLRKALLFIEHKDAYLPDPHLIELIDRAQTNPIDILNEITSNKYEQMQPESIISSLLFIYHNALYEKINVDNLYKSEIIVKIKKSLTINEIITRISFLLNALNDATINLNKKLYLFSVLTAVRL